MSFIDDCLAKPWGTHNNIEFATSLTGSPNAPVTTENANDPGLESKGIFGTTKGNGKMRTHHWIMVVIGILIALWALSYFGVFGASTPAA